MERAVEAEKHESDGQQTHFHIDLMLFYLAACLGADTAVCVERVCCERRIPSFPRGEISGALRCHLERK